MNKNLLKPGKKTEDFFINDDLDPLELHNGLNLNFFKDKSFYEKNERFLKVKKYFKDASKHNWNDWKWQLANSITDLEELTKILDLSEGEIEGITKIRNKIPLRITPYYLSLIDQNNIHDEIRKSVIPSLNEFIESVGEADDPLNEDSHSPVPGIVHRYPDRVLFLITDFCSTYCRYCTRSRMIGKNISLNFDIKKIEKGINYIKSNPQIRDVLLSGGDPLTLSTDILEYILSRLKSIKHVEMIRIGTKVPVVLPQRISKELVDVLKKYHPLYLSIHFIHPKELTNETAAACNILADAGIPLGSQTVLLKGVNDNVETMRKLMTGLLKIRVRPYYIYQCDPIKGSNHFRTTVEKGLEIIKGLRGHISGYAIPHYVIDAPGGGGKIPLLPEYFIKKEGSNIELKNFEDKIFIYPDISVD